MIALLMTLSFAGSAWGMYLTDATRSAKACVGGTAAGTACIDNTPCLGGGTCQVIAGEYLNPDDGVCVVGVAADGRMKIDASIKNQRDCAAYTTGLTGMNTALKCLVADGTGNDGFKHAWTTSSVCVNSANPTVAIPLTDLDRTLPMCQAKGGTTITPTGLCTAYGWVYMNRKADGALPVSGTGVYITDGTQSTDNLGFCYASMDMTSATYVNRDTCPSEHNNNPPAAVSVCVDPALTTIATCQIAASRAWSAALSACVDTGKTTAAACIAPEVWTSIVAAGVAPAGEWTACGSNLVQGCQTQASYDAGLGWSLPDSGAVNTGTGVPSSSAVRVCVDSAFADKTACEGANASSTAVPAPYYWNPDLGACIDTAKTTTGTTLTCKNTTLSIVIWADNNRCIYQYGQKGELAATALPVNTATPVGIGTVVDLTAYTNQGDCLAAGYAWDNWLPNINRTNLTGAPLPAGAQIVKLDATTLVKNGGGNFSSGTGSVCQKCHSDQSRAYQERNKPGYPETRHKQAADNPGPWQTNFTAANSAWGIKGVQCEICHSTARAAQDDLIQVVPAGVAATSTQPGAGAPISATGHNKTEVGGHVTDVCFHCHGNFPSTNAGNVIPANGSDFALTPKGLAPIGNQFLNSPHAKYSSAGTSSKVDIGNKNLFGSRFVGYLCRAAADSSSIYSTVFQGGVAKKIPFLDSLTNVNCTNAATGNPSGAAGVWEKEGDIVSPVPVPPAPLDTKQGNCMTCHDVHWALASTDPEAEPIRRECTTCHENPGTSATTAPQINLATINHQSGAGTPIADPNDPDAACESCHMPKSSATGSYMHLWRINTDPNYVTMGTTKANVAADGLYVDAAWVDIDHACGQCHGGGTAQGPGYQPVPPALYRTRATLAPVAAQMHASSGVNYGVTFSTTIDPNNSLRVTADASVDCGGVTCPPFTYDWNWGNGSTHGTTDPATKDYTPNAGKYEITLIVKLASNGQQVGAPVTRGVTLSAPNVAPTATGTCVFTADTWTMLVTDASTDTVGTPHVVVNFGDGTSSAVAAGGTITRVYTRTGTFPVTITATDVGGLSSSFPCATAVTSYFSLGGKVLRDPSPAPAVPIPGATVTLWKRGTFIKSVTSGVNGSFSFGSLKPGGYTITAAKTGYVFGNTVERNVGPSQTDANISPTSTPTSPRTEGVGYAN